MGGRWMIVVGASVLACAVGPGASVSLSAPVDLPAQANRLDSRTGAGPVAGAGDVNGDGYGDVIVGMGLPRGKGNTRFAGGAFVQFSHPFVGAIDIAGGRTEGIRILEAREGDQLGADVAGAGDFNGDGLADVLVTTHQGEQFSRPIPGSRTRLGVRGAAYLVFGSRNSGTVDLAHLGLRGLIVKGIGDGGAAGVGDVNGDGRADIAVGDSDTYRDGGAHVILGGPLTGELDVAHLGDRGFSIRGAPGDLAAYRPVAGAGDVNGDGLADVVVGAPGGVGAPVGDESEPLGAGLAYVVYGRRSTQEVNLARLGADGLRMGPPRSLGLLGWSVAGAGDVNGDGLADVIVGAPEYPTTRLGSGPGAAFVVFGRRGGGRVDLERLGEGGFEIRGEGATPGAGRSVAGAGDVNGDGLADVLVGAVQIDEFDLNDGSLTRAYVVFGRRSGGAVRLADISSGSGAGGFAMTGFARDLLGWSVGSQDTDGDGHPELLLTAGATCRGGAERIVIAGEPFGIEPRQGGALYMYSPGRAAPRSTGPLVGTDGPDSLAGGPDEDRFAGRGGDDKLTGAARGDCLFGDEGADSLAGGDGPDFLAGGDQDDRLLGQGGIDALHGNRGRDLLDGGGEADGLDGGPGDDTLRGGTGNDMLEEDLGNDRLWGGSGDDEVGDSRGNNVLHGGPGDDFLTEGGGKDRLYGDSGNDHLGSVAAPPGTDPPFHGPGDFIDGGSGNDMLEGTVGVDVLLGGRGKDVIDSFGGLADTVRCGPGRDRAYVDRRDRVSGCETVRFRPRVPPPR